jgi:hypothetical protein
MDSGKSVAGKQSKPSHFDAAPFLVAAASVFITPEPGMSQSLLFTARTKNAWVHKAVIETADAVDVELQNCAAIEQQGGFARGVRLDPKLYYAWPWPTRMARDIKPVDDTFVYVNGAFRPEPHRVLALLAGTRLYGSPLAAARELLQNAFDAVREQMAHQRLSDPAGHTDATQQALSSLHRVDLEYEHNDGRIWLICKDTGVGMTRRMIERYLLVSGSQPRPEVLELQRRCAARNIDFERSGEFGIGVLSYFMVADKLIIETRASQEGHADIEAHGWRFESDGLEDFGELKALKLTASGTTVRLRLKENFANDSFLDAMHAYVKNVVVRAPCRLLLFKTGGGNIALQAGWTTSPDDLREYFLGEVFQHRDYSSDKLRSRRRSTSEESEAERLAYLRTSAESKLRFTKPCEIKLPNNQGSARVHLPYFEIEGGASPYFVDQRSDIVHVLPNGNFGDMMKSKHIRSWRGFKTSASHGIRSSHVEPNILIETDLTRGASISIDRQHIESDNELELLNFIRDQTYTSIGNLYATFAKSPYAALCGTSILRYAIEQKSVSYWAFARDFAASDEPSSWDWRPVQFPALFYSEKVGRYRRPLSKSLLKMAGAKDELRPMEFSATRKFMPVPWLKASRLVFSVWHVWPLPFVIFESGDSHRPDSRLSAKFPPEWRDILAVKHEELLLFNEENPIFLTVTPSDWKSYLAMTELKPLEAIIEMVLTSRNSIAAAFILANAGKDSEFWNALHDNYLEHYQSILEACMPGQNKKIRIWKADYESGIRTVDIDGAHFDKFEDGNYTKILPTPSDKSWELGSSLTRGRSIFNTE